MSISSLQSNIQRTESDIASLTKKASDLSHKLASKASRLADAQKGASRATSSSALENRLREIASLQKDIARIESDKAAVEKRIGDKRRELHRFGENLAKEQERETKKQIEENKRRLRQQDEAEKRRRREIDEYNRRVDQDLASRRLYQSAKAPAIVSGDLPPEVQVEKHDLFISHASEDKDEFVRPLAAALTDAGLEVWYDETSLKLGDSLRQSVDKGLANSRYGVVVLSTAFFSKNWPQYELNGLVAKEMNGVKVILPIWHKVSKDEVLSYSPALADKLALNTALYSVAEIAQKIAEAVQQ